MVFRVCMTIFLPVPGCTFVISHAPESITDSLQGEYIIRFCLKNFHVERDGPGKVMQLPVDMPETNQDVGIGRVELIGFKKCLFSILIGLFTQQSIGLF